MTWHPEELFFHFPSLFARQIPQLVRHIVWEMRQHMTETGRISGASQVYVLLRKKETRVYAPPCSAKNASCGVDRVQLRSPQLAEVAYLSEWEGSFF